MKEKQTQALVGGRKKEDHFSVNIIHEILV
jgi:hypothetical protein